MPRALPALMSAVDRRGLQQRGEPPVDAAERSELRSEQGYLWQSVSDAQPVSTLHILNYR